MEVKTKWLGRKCAISDLADLLLVATPWRWHAPMAKYAMEQGIHVATEVPMAYKATRQHRTN